MKTIKNKFLNASIFTKILFSTMLLIVTPLVLVCFFTYYKITDVSHKEFSTYSLETTRQLSSNIDFLCGEMDKITQIIATNPDLQNSLNRKGNIDYKSLNTISDSIYNITSSRMDDVTLIIAGNNGDLYYNSEYYDTNSSFPIYDTSKSFLSYNFLNNPLIENLDKSNQRRIFTGLMKPPYRDTSGEYYIIIRKIVDRYSGNILGYVYLDIPYNKINELIASPANSEQSDILIINKQEIIFSKNTNRLHQKIPDSLWENLSTYYSSSHYKTSFDNNAFYTHYTIPTTGWKVVFLHSGETFNGTSSRILHYIIMVAIICIFFAFLIAILISYIITKPLKELASLMKEIEKNNLDIVFVSNSNDEISQLGKIFNQMITQIKLMLQQVYDSKLAEKDAVIYALQTQINPHFLYNTLQSISDISISYDIMEIPEMCTCLSSMLRYSINNQKRFVRLYDEIKNIKNYYTIHSIKYPGKLSLDININNDYYDVRIPRLILQPLVENSCVHGFSANQKNFCISIRSTIENDNLNIIVSDNGQGIPPDTLNNILNSLKSKDATRHTENYLALNNVNQRLVLTYGPSYALKIESHLSQGTHITISIPINGYVNSRKRNKSESPA